MTDPAAQARSCNPEPALHVCNTYRQLLHALSDASLSAGPVTVLYLQDDVPVAPDARDQLAELCPRVRLLYRCDRALVGQFANLARWLPGIVRRNVRLDPRRGYLRPSDWTPVELAGRRFRTAYVYNAGFFATKIAAGLSDRVVLRESGMNNYASLRVPPFKALLRMLSGMNPARQVFGDEKWIETVEVEYPDRLPLRVRFKGRRLVYADALRRGDQDHLRKVLGVLVPDLVGLRIEGKAAVILTQPLDEIGLCSETEKRSLYQHISDRLTAEGAVVYVKNHPREADYALAGAKSLPKTLPMEAWGLTGQPPFSIAVAFHSAALNAAEVTFARRVCQLFPSLSIPVRSGAEWCAAVDAQLRDAGTTRL